MRPGLFLFSWLLLFALPRPSAGEGIYDIVFRGKSAQEAGEYYRAIELFQTALSINPAYLAPLRGLAESYFALGEYQEALRFSQEARRYAREDGELKNLEGRILLGLGRFDEAEERFRQVLEVEPNNINAQFGMAEREIAAGKIQNAASRYREALRISPENRRALLSLVLLYDEIGNAQAAENYVTQALLFYSDLPRVRWIAARHYFSRGDVETAWEQASAAFALDPSFLEAGLLLAELAIERDKASEGIEILKPLLEEHRESPLLWYQLGMAHRLSGAIEPAILALGTSLSLRSGDDIVRIVLENTLQELPLDDPRRERYAQYHFALGEGYEDRNLLREAAQEYRRGLQINPYSREGRMRNGEMYRKKGYLSRYQEELLILKQGEDGDTALSDNLEMLESKLEDSVSRRWGVEQFTLARQEYSLGIFLVSRTLFHAGGGEDMAQYVKDLMEGVQNLSIKISTSRETDFAQAFRRARELGTDYFLIMEVSESERILSLENRFYVSETGSLLKEWGIFRTGNHRIPEAFRRTVRDVSGFLTPYGRLLERKFDDGLVDLGNMDGLAPGDRYAVIRSGQWELKKDGLGFFYEPEDVVGEFTVTQTDDLVCQGELKKNGFFDMINQGDYLFALGEEELPSLETGSSLPPDLYTTLLRLSD